MKSAKLFNEKNMYTLKRLSIDDKEEIKPVEISSVDEIKLQPKKTILPKKEDNEVREVREFREIRVIH